jgi:ABC-type nitrate/sulfonate/bicarbonate transport system substrate-binding protein
MRRIPLYLSLIASAVVVFSPQRLDAAQGKKLRPAFSALAYANPPFWIAHELRLFENFDIAKLDFPLPVISVVSTRRFVEANPDIILNVLRATAEAIYLYKTEPELTLPVVAKFMRVPKDDPALRQSQQSLGLLMNQDLAPSLEGIKFVLDFLAEKQPSLKTKNPADFVDVRFLRKLEAEIFFKQFAPK